MDWYLYIDWGSGYTLLTPYNLNVNLGFKVDDNINPGVKRKNVNGSFILLDNDYTSAYTYFITNGSVNAPFRIYENGILGVGTLQFQGFANLSETFNARESVVTFNAFTTDDDYDPVLAVWNDDTTIVESLSLSNDFTRFYSQGQHANCSKLQGYSLSGSTWATTGNALTLWDVGRVSMTILGSNIVIYDNLKRYLNSYSYSAPNWAAATLGTSYDIASGIGSQVKNCDICYISTSQIAMVDDGQNELHFLTTTTGTFTLNNTYDLPDISRPSVALITNSGTTYIAIIDNGTKILRAYNTSGVQIGNTLSLGEIENPSICPLDSGANSRIAIIDSKTNFLRAYTFDGSDFSELPTGIKIGITYEPTLAYDGTNAVTVMDAIGGFMGRYSFSGTAWTQSGTNTTISGGYMAAGALDGTVLGVVQSDCLSMQTSRCASWYELANAVLSDLSLGLSIPSSGNGADFDITKVYFGEMSNLKQVNSDTTPVNYTKWKLKELLEFAELFQNYWYIDGSNIKFRQPDGFSSVGTNFSISSLTRGGLYVKTENNQLLYQEGYNLSKEKLIFNNERNQEFIGLPIDYGRDNESEIVYPFQYTADFEFIVDYFTGVTQNLNLSGQFIAYIELDATSGYGVVSATGVIGSADTRNNYLSKSQIMESFWKDYRYTSDANFTLNGSSVSPQDTCKDILRYPTLQLDYDDLSLTAFPSSVGSLTWDTGKVGYIYEFFVNLSSRILTINSGKLDL